MVDTDKMRIGDFLTDAQIERCIKLGSAHAIRERVIEPNLAEINRKTGHANDARYLAYAVEYALGTVARKGKR